MKEVRPVSIEAARELMDFGGGALSHTIAEGQLEGAVAIHNILAAEGFAYLADEVGMGKTYVALGVAALLRFFTPGLRVLYVAPRENIQSKWVKELRNFTRRNWLRPDLLVKDFHGSPAYKTTSCRNLADWALRAVRDPASDFFVRMSSFRFPLAADSGQWRARREELERAAPALSLSRFDLRNKERFKESYARAVNSLLPHYDLVVVDEAHNLKHGLDSQASRNRLLAAVLGRLPPDAEGEWPRYGRRFDRVLLLSATPLETEYEEVWRQLDLFGFGGRVPELKDQSAAEPEKAAAAARFMVRRLTGLTIGGELHTKNMYRREWRGGGCVVHDEPLEVPDERQRLVVALVQKKVGEVINSQKFGPSFQVGMLSSFESFLETAKVAGGDGDESNFDQSEQTDDPAEKEGIDTRAVNRLAESYYREFGEPMPHPKMDAVVGALEGTFLTGDKTLVFVRRVKSVTELREKLNRRYDARLASYLDEALTPPLREELKRWRRDYETERKEGGGRRSGEGPAAGGRGRAASGDGDAGGQPEAEEGGTDTFFSWFFSGQGAGAAFRRNRLQGEGSAYSTFFEDNYVAALLGAASPERLAAELGPGGAGGLGRLRDVAYGAYASRTQQPKFPRLRVFEAYQQAALALLAQSKGAHAEGARVVLRERYAGLSPPPLPAPPGFPWPEGYLDAKTFFTELRLRPGLRGALWPEPRGEDFRARFVEGERRRELLAAAARLGHSYVDLWACFANRVGTLSPRAQEQRTGDRGDDSLIADFLDLLEAQGGAPGAGGAFNSFRELSEIGRHFDLIMTVNFPEAASEALAALPRLFAGTLGSQEPVGGMSGGVNKRLVGQFRMPGYPLVLITTDVLQEGEDLHTFCSRVVHYGISWTPSALEQRTGRVDRISSLTHRRLDGRAARAHPDELLQVYYPYLADTVEVIQVERVLERVNKFIRLVHRAAGGADAAPRIDTRAEFVRARGVPPQIGDPLRSAFPVRPGLLRGSRRVPGEHFAAVGELLSHARAVAAGLGELLRVSWEPSPDEASFYGTVYVDGGRLLGPEDGRAAGAGGVRQQPFALVLRPSGGGPVLLHAVSPVGRLSLSETLAAELVGLASALRGAKLCEVPWDESDSYTLSVEGDLIFGPGLTQAEEVADLLARVAGAADALERAYLGRDATFGEFVKALKREARRGGAD